MLNSDEAKYDPPDIGIVDEEELHRLLRKEWD